RFQDLSLLPAHSSSLEGGGGFHGHQAQELQHVILDHIAEQAGLFVIRASALHPQLFGDVNLNMVDVSPVPERFKNPVREPEDQEILNRLLSEVMVDPIDLLLLENLGDDAIQFPGACEVSSKRLFDDNAGPRFAGILGLCQPRCTKMLNDDREKTRRSRKIEKPVSGSSPLLIQPVQ